jgi:hypothetical protein
MHFGFIKPIFYLGILTAKSLPAKVKIPKKRRLLIFD